VPAKHPLPLCFEDAWVGVPLVWQRLARGQLGFQRLDRLELGCSRQRVGLSASPSDTGMPAASGDVSVPARRGRGHSKVWPYYWDVKGPRPLFGPD
jgi:hypothetical protein